MNKVQWLALIGIWGLVFAGVVLASEVFVGSSAATRTALNSNPLDATAAYATLCAENTAAANDYSMSWRLFGTPTPTTPPTDFTPTEASITGDPVRGQTLFVGVGNCAACHAVTGDTRLVGPSLAGIAVSAGSRVQGQSAAEYLLAVLIDPSKIVPSQLPGVMPTTYGQQFNTQDLADMVAYMLTLE
jgi:mono/diheme cytochrome c family protein